MWKFFLGCGLWGHSAYIIMCKARAVNAGKEISRLGTNNRQTKMLREVLHNISSLSTPVPFHALRRTFLQRPFQINDSAARHCIFIWSWQFHGILNPQFPALISWLPNLQNTFYCGMQPARHVSQPGCITMICFMTSESSNLLCYALLGDFFVLNTFWFGHLPTA